MQKSRTKMLDSAPGDQTVQTQKLGSGSKDSLGGPLSLVMRGPPHLPFVVMGRVSLRRQPQLQQLLPPRHTAAAPLVSKHSVWVLEAGKLLPG